MGRWMLTIALASLALLAAVVLHGGGMRAGAATPGPAANRGGAQLRSGKPSAGAGNPGLSTLGSADLALPSPVPLLTGWRFLADRHDVGRSRHWQLGSAVTDRGSPVAIPNDFNPTVSSASDQGTIGWYAVRFRAPAGQAGLSWAIKFDEVRRHSEVWLNGHEIGTSSDPYVPFTLPATSLRPGMTNLLVVRVDNLFPTGSFPQDWWNWGGIVRRVMLEPVSRISVSDLGVLPQLGCGYRCGDLLVQGIVHNHADVPLTPAMVVHTVSPSGIKLTFFHRLARIPPAGSKPISFRVPVHGPPELWSPHSPSLYQVSVSTSVGHRLEQLDQMRVGLRSVQVHGGVLYLNGQRLWLHGASIHEDMPGHGAALTDGDINTIVSELRSVGANVTRTHYLLSARLLDALDAAGIMVWSQPPVDHADSVLATSDGRSRALDILRATILAERSHPSVIVNSVGNELSPNPDATAGTHSYLSAAIPLARRLDPAARVALDIYCYPGYPTQSIYSKLDVLGISSYYGWYLGSRGHSIASLDGLKPFLTLTHARYPSQAIVVSEFGAEGLYDGSAAVKGTYQFQTDYLRNTIGVLDQLPFMNGAIYWTLREFAVAPGWTGGANLPTGFTADGLHHKGLISYDGNDKPVFGLAQQVLASSPSFTP
ncbi:MAG: glycoside hydrolase family 2 protein [Solirubrobacteraceae bacterium]